MGRKDEGSWSGAIFMMAVGYVLWFGTQGFWWGIGGAIAFLSGVFYLPPLARWVEKDQESPCTNCLHGPVKKENDP